VGAAPKLPTKSNSAVVLFRFAPIRPTPVGLLIAPVGPTMMPFALAMKILGAAPVPAPTMGVPLAVWPVALEYTVPKICETLPLASTLRTAASVTPVDDVK